MKIICVARNYKKHAEELNNEVPAEPVVFLKPDSAIVLNNKPFFIPEFSHEIHYETEIVVRINRVGRHIEERFAHRYYKEIGLGIDFTARDLQQKLSTEGLPWDLAKGFDGSAPISAFYPLDEFSQSIQDVNFSLLVNGEERQNGNTGNMIFSVDRIISYVSQFITLKIGDLIFTGTPEGVGKVEINDHLQAFINDRCLLDFYVK